MTQCKNCGATLDEGDRVCAKCGAPADGSPAAGPATGTTAPGAPAAPAASGGVFSDLVNLARGAKGLALLFFLLPWITVSCAGQTIASATGLELATGGVKSPAAAGGMMAPGTDAPSKAESYSIDIFILVAALLIIASLVATFVMPRRRAALIAMVGSAAAALLIGYDVLIRIKGKITDQIEDQAGGASSMPGAGGADVERQMQQQMEQMTQAISVDASIGFWLTVIALIAAAVLNWMIHSGRTRLSGPEPGA
ncbi:zinc ribbon domain-containing protein [Allosphingosinicella sp.]|jgi:lysylphosphatidylglycerol synthetase-like protein (DUF2156 family)|uniref:zinc ribbon domain-containing protein n=1 Tax=Allosphingosinicella sp. TaxID=2823234 RepID=UPI002F0D0B88